MSVEVKRITLREVHLALREPFTISSGTVTERRVLLLTLEDHDGVGAWSECVAGEAPNYSPETIETAWVAIRQWVAPRVLGRPFAGPEAVHAALEADFRGHRMAKAAVEMGAWALEASRREVSLAELIGGTRDRIPVGISLGIQADPQTLVERVRDGLAAGYRKVKIKIRPGADLEYVRAAREAAGPDAPLMVDANNAYTMHDADRLHELDDLGLLMIEQPLGWEDLVQHAELQRELRTPICLDESITGLDRARDMVTLGAGRIINIKPGRVGGFTPSKAIHDFCAARGIPVWCGGMLETGIGRAYNVALASLPNFTLPGDVSPSARYWARDLVDPEWTMSPDGSVAVPRAHPGLGVRVDADRVEDLTVRCETLSAS